MSKGPWKDVSRYSRSEDSPGLLLWRTHAIWKRSIEAALAPHALTHVQFVLLAGLGYLTKQGEMVSQKELALFTHCDVTMTSQVLRNLEKRELIGRTQKTGDDRTKYPHLTLEGLKTIKAAMQAVEAADELFFEKLGEGRPAFLEDLRRLIGSRF